MANEYVHAVDTEAYSYVFDWASLVALGHVDSVGLDRVYGLRMLALPKASSTRTGIPGVFAVNECTTEEDVGVQQIQLPMLVAMKDKGAPDMIAYAFKLAGTPEPKLYVAAVPAALQISADKWVCDIKDAQLLKMNVLDGFKTIKNNDGNNMVAACDEWLKHHAQLFRGDKLPKSIKACKGWGNSPTLFGKNLAPIFDHATLLTRKAAKSASGAPSLQKRAQRSAARNAKSTEDNTNAERDLLLGQIDTLEKARAAMEKKSKYYNLPMRHRILETTFEVLENGEISIKGLDDFIKDLSTVKPAPPGQIGTDLRALQQRADILKPLALHSVPAIGPSSPMLREPVEQPPPLPPPSKPVLPEPPNETAQANANERGEQQDSSGEEEYPDDQESDSALHPPDQQGERDDSSPKPRKGSVEVRSPSMNLRDRAAIAAKQAAKDVGSPNLEPPAGTKPKPPKKPVKPAGKQPAESSEPAGKTKKREYHKSDRWWSSHGAKLARRGGRPDKAIHVESIDEDAEEAPVAPRGEKTGGVCLPAFQPCVPAFVLYWLLNVCNLLCAGQWKAIVDQLNERVKELSEQVAKLEADKRELKQVADSADVRVGKKEIEVLAKSKDEINAAYDKGYSTALEHLEKQQSLIQRMMGGAMPAPPGFVCGIPSAGGITRSSGGSASSIQGDTSRMTSPAFGN